MVKGAWGDFYQFAPPLDTFDKGVMSGNELSFFSCSLRVFCKAFLKTRIFWVKFPPHLSSLLILSSSASSWVDSLFNLPLAYCFFQWYTRLDERLCLLGSSSRSSGSTEHFLHNLSLEFGRKGSGFSHWQVPLHPFGDLFDPVRNTNNSNPFCLILGVHSTFR